MPVVIDHHRHMHDFFLRHGHGYLNDIFNCLLNNSLLLRDMVIDYHFLFDMMMTVMMHYSGNEDHFVLCHRHWDLDNLLHLALENALLRDHLWPLHNFLPLMWDVKVHNHLLLDMVMTMVVHDRWNMHNLFLCHRDWHFNYMLALSGQVG